MHFLPYYLHDAKGFYYMEEAVGVCQGKALLEHLSSHGYHTTSLLYRRGTWMDPTLLEKTALLSFKKDAGTF